METPNVPVNPVPTPTPSQGPQLNDKSFKWSLVAGGGLLLVGIFSYFLAGGGLFKGQLIKGSFGAGRIDECLEKHEAIDFGDKNANRATFFTVRPGCDNTKVTSDDSNLANVFWSHIDAKAGATPGSWDFTYTDNLENKDGDLTWKFSDESEPRVTKNLSMSRSFATAGEQTLTISKVIQVNEKELQTADRSSAKIIATKKILVVLPAPESKATEIPTSPATDSNSAYAAADFTTNQTVDANGNVAVTYLNTAVAEYGTATAYKWTFSDGTTSTEKTPTFTYKPNDIDSIRKTTLEITTTDNRVVRISPRFQMRPDTGHFPVGQNGGTGTRDTSSATDQAALATCKAAISATATDAEKRTAEAACLTANASDSRGTGTTSGTGTRDTSTSTEQTSKDACIAAIPATATALEKRAAEEACLTANTPAPADATADRNAVDSRSTPVDTSSTTADRNATDTRSAPADTTPASGHTSAPADTAPVSGHTAAPAPADTIPAAKTLVAEFTCKLISDDGTTSMYQFTDQSTLDNAPLTDGSVFLSYGHGSSIPSVFTGVSTPDTLKNSNYPVTDANINLPVFYSATVGGQTANRAPISIPERCSGTLNLTPPPVPNIPGGGLVAPKSASVDSLFADVLSADVAHADSASSINLMEGDGLVIVVDNSQSPKTNVLHLVFKGKTLNLDLPNPADSAYQGTTAGTSTHTPASTDTTASATDQAAIDACLKDAGVDGNTDPATVKRATADCTAKNTTGTGTHTGSSTTDQAAVDAQAAIDACIATAQERDPNADRAVITAKCEAENASTTKTHKALATDQTAVDAQAAIDACLKDAGIDRNSDPATAERATADCTAKTTSTHKALTTDQTAVDAQAVIDSCVATAQERDPTADRAVITTKCEAEAISSKDMEQSISTADQTAIEQCVNDRASSHPTPTIVRQLTTECEAMVLNQSKQTHQKISAADQASIDTCIAAIPAGASDTDKRILADRCNEANTTAPIDIKTQAAIDACVAGRTKRSFTAEQVATIKAECTTANTNTATDQTLSATDQERLMNCINADKTGADATAVRTACMTEITAANNTRATGTKTDTLVTHKTTDTTAADAAKAAADKAAADAAKAAANKAAADAAKAATDKAAADAAKAAADQAAKGGGGGGGGGISHSTQGSSSGGVPTSGSTGGGISRGLTKEVKAGAITAQQVTSTFSCNEILKSPLVDTSNKAAILMSELGSGKSTITRIIEGFLTDTGREFRGSQSMTRAEWIKTVEKSLCLFSGDEKTFALPSFIDVLPDAHWAFNYVEFAKENGLVNGYKDGSFGPDREITKAEAITILNRVNKTPTAPASCKMVLNDGSTDDWFYKDLRDAYCAGIAMGDGQGNFEPQKAITRDEAVTILYNLFVSKVSAK